MPPSNDQHWNPTQYAENARFVAELGMPVVELLAPQPGERILDLGCGDGALTLKLHEMGCRVVGVDASGEMIAAAKSLKIDARVADGQALAFDSEFDAVFSNAALHWMPNPGDVVSGVWRALKPGGRFVGEFGGHGNVAAIVAALELALAARSIECDFSWYFPQPEEYRALLESTGFTVDSITLTPRPTPLPGDVVPWLETFAQPFTATVGEAERKAFLAEVTEALRPVLADDKGTWSVDYVRLRFRAEKPRTNAT